MSMMPRVCCVPNCENRDGILHRIPSYDAETFKSWVQRIANPKFENLTPRRIVELYRVCGIHFPDNAKYSNGTKIKKYVYPSLHLPDPVDISLEVEISEVTTETTNNLLNNNKMEADNPYKDACRICLCTSSESMHSLSEDTSYEIDLKHILEELFSLQVDLGIDPTNICLQCKEKLIDFYKFKQQFEESYNILEKLSTQENEKITAPEESDDNIVEKRSTQEKETFNTTVESNNILEQISMQEKETLNITEELSVPTTDTDPLENEFTVVKTILKKKNGVNVSTEYKCGKCTLIFTKCKLFQDHIKICNTLFKCSHCDKRFINRFHLLRHEKNHEIWNKKKEQSAERNHLCVVCGKRFSCRSNLLVHSRIHSGKKPFTCAICNRSFTQWSTLKGHELSHTGVKSYICEYCGKAFPRMDSLAKHNAGHENERKYACPICEKRFNYRSQQIRHISTHSGEKKFQCDYCGKAFNRQCNLKVHTKTHTGEKSFQCVVCGQRFLQRHVLKYHLNTHQCEIANNK